MSTIKVNNIDTQSGTTVTLPTGKVLTITDAGGISIGGTVVTSSGAELNILDGVTSTAAELNVLDGIPAGLTATELGYVDGVTSALQTQLDAKLSLSGGTMSGTLQVADQLVQRPEFKDYSETKTALSPAATVDIDLEVGNVFTITADQNTTFTFSNPSPTGKACAFTLIWTQDSSDRTITWPGTVDWAGGSAPDVTSGSGKIDIYMFFTMDAGTIWYGFQPGADMG